MLEDMPGGKAKDSCLLLHAVQGWCITANSKNAVRCESCGIARGGPASYMVQSSGLRDPVACFDGAIKQLQAAGTGMRRGKVPEYSC